MPLLTARTEAKVQVSARMTGIINCIQVPQQEVLLRFQKEKISIMEVVAIKLRQVFSNWIQCMLLVHSTTNQQH